MFAEYTSAGRIVLDGKNEVFGSCKKLVLKAEREVLGSLARIMMEYDPPCTS